MDTRDRYDGELPHQYADQYVAYLDIMGYKSYIKRAQCEGTELQAIRTLGRALKPLIPPRGANPVEDALIVRMFSDSVYLRLRPNVWHDVLGFSILWELVNIPYCLATRVGLFMRGALVWGKHYDDELVLFSPALVEAVKLENERCCYPRILVVDRARDILQNTSLKPDIGGRQYQVPFLLEDDDGEFFLNYLAVDLALREDRTEQANEWLSAHRDHIATQTDANRDNARLASKYEWLRNYHNRYCQEYLPPGVGKRFLIRDA